MAGCGHDLYSNEVSGCLQGPSTMGVFIRNSLKVPLANPRHAAYVIRTSVEDLLEASDSTCGPPFDIQRRVARGNL